MSEDTLVVDTDGKLKDMYGELRKTAMRDMGRTRYAGGNYVEYQSRQLQTERCLYSHMAMLAIAYSGYASDRDEWLALAVTYQNRAQDLHLEAWTELDFLINHNALNDLDGYGESP